LRNRITIFKYILLIIISLSFSNSYAQLTKITGVVIDSKTEKPLPFVNIQLIGTNIGCTTGFDGKFAIETKTKTKSDSILISYIGYKPQKRKIKRHAYQNFKIKLISSNFELSEVVIRPTENPAHVILRKVIKNKDKNSKYGLDAYEYDIYNKIQIDANNITESFKKKRSLKPFQFIFENVDTSTINGKSYLPLLLTETVSEYIYRKSPREEKETIIASRASGINNSSISTFLGNMYQKISIYENYIGLFNKNFVSPVADFGLRTYRYYLVDSATIDNHWCYKLMFKPRRKQELTFTGEIWITDSTWAIKQVDMKITEVNMNFVNAMSIAQNFNLVDNKYWMVDRESFIVDFNVVDKSEKVTGFYGHKTSLFKNIKVNKPRPEEDYKTNVAVNVEKDAWDKPKEYWDTTRFEELSNEEETIYRMVDTIVEMPAFKNIYDIITMVVTGYYQTKYFEFGPYFTLYSFNGVEGHRFKIGGRTSNKWNDKFRLYGHLAYGTRDEKFKYKLGAIFIFNKNPRRALDISYKKDMEQLGESVRALKQDNIVSSIFRKYPNYSLTMVEQYKAAFSYEYFNGFSNKLTFTRREVFPLLDQKFQIYENGPNNAPTAYNSLITSEIELKTHFAYREVFLVEKFNRKSFGTKYPRLNIWYAYGIPNLFKSQFSYHKFQIAIKQRVNLWSFGYTQYILSWGKIWGNLPYPILEVHPGNETYSYDDYAFSRMNYYEFISDEYFVGNISHNFQGLFFNHIPLLRKLKWREVIYGKILLGKLSKENLEYSKFPSNTSVLTKPYYEVGAGIENIFKVIRVDASWRLSYLDKPNVIPFGFMITLKVDF